MQEQNFKNHARLVPLFHFVMFGMVLTVLVLSVINIINEVSLSSVMFVIIAVSTIIGLFQFRGFALRAQDRAIRAEENLRYFVLTGKLLNSGLTMGQIIALRFAPDEEFVALADAALKQNMSGKDIKQAIKNWKADHHRA